MKKIIIVIVVVIVLLGGCLAAIGGSGGSSNKEDSSKTETSKDTDSDKKEVETKESEPEEVEIVYEECNVDDMMELLKSNALNASNTYKDKYVEVTGKLSAIDSSGKYISLLPINDEWAFTGVQCYIKNDEQLEKVSAMSTDETVVLRGKIKDVGEVLGYSLDIDEIL